MAKNEQVLTIEPQNELRFRGPFNVPVTSYMKLSNPTPRKVMFKIKTTAPKKYCVRPNSGTLDSNDTVEIAICLQPFIFDPNEKNKHKFMVQTIFAPDGDVSADQVWKDMSSDKIMDSKLKCVFEVPQSDNEGKEEPTKASPKATVQSSSAAHSDDELKKAKDEVISLREEESALRQENLRLKEDILRLKQAYGVAPNKNEPITSKYQPPPISQQQNISVYYMAIAVIIAIFGIIVGKFIL